jgi:hypothetical protein
MEIYRRQVDSQKEFTYYWTANQIIHHSENHQVLNCPFFFAKLPEWPNEEEGTFR